MSEFERLGGKPTVSETRGFLIQASDLGCDQNGWHLRDEGYRFAEKVLPNILARFIKEVGQRDIRITVTLEADL